MDPKRKALLLKAKALKAEAQGLIDKPRAERTEEEQARLDAIIGEQGELVQLNADLDEMDRLAELERNAPSAGIDDPRPAAPGERPVVRVTRVHDNAGDAPWASLGEFLSAVGKAGVPRGRFPGAGEMDPRLLAASGMSEGIGADGGFLVETQFSTDLLNRAVQGSQLAPRTRAIEVGAGFDSVELPYIDETSRANGSRWGGVRAYWKAEAASVIASQPKIGEHEIRLQELMAICYATERLIQDSVALESVIMPAYEEEMGFKLDDAIIEGTGGGIPLGILNSGNAALITVAKETGQAAKTIVKENIDNMWSRMRARNRFNAVWLINQDCEPALDGMSATVGTGGVPVYLPPSGLSGTRLASLKGAPVIPIEQCSTLGTVGDIVLVDLKEYLLARKGTVEQASSMHVRFLYNEMTYRFNMRANGMPARRSAVTPFKGSNTLSPYVALATRA